MRRRRAHLLCESGGDRGLGVLARRIGVEAGRGVEARERHRENQRGARLLREQQRRESAPRVQRPLDVDVYDEVAIGVALLPRPTDAEHTGIGEGESGGPSEFLALSSDALEIVGAADIADKTAAGAVEFGVEGRRARDVAPPSTRSSSRRPASACAQVSELSLDEVLQQGAVERKVGHDLCQPGALILELAHALHLGGHHAGVLLLPRLVGRPADLGLAADLFDRRSVLALSDDERLLGVRELRCLHRPQLLPAREMPAKILAQIEGVFRERIT